MFKERENNDVNLLKEALGKREISWILTDGDGTIFDTVYVFRKHMGEYASFIAGCVNQPQSLVYDFLTEALSHLRAEFSVHPSVMYEAARITAKRFAVEQIKAEPYLDKLLTVYQIAPPLFDGAYEAIQKFRSTGIPIALVTHADQKWTDNKCALNGLHDAFAAKFCFPSYGIKGEDEWRHTLTYLNVDARKVIVIGDSWSSDIRPALANGVPSKNIYRIKTDFDDANKNGVNGICEVLNFSDIIPILLNLNESI